MWITTVSATPDGGSCFGRLEIDLADAGGIGRLSEPVPVSGVIFRENDPGYDLDWHCAPQRQLIVLLDGEIEVEVTSGERRRFRGGEVLLVEDVDGRGHRTRSIGDRVRRSLFVPLLGAVSSPSESGSAS